MTKTLKNVYVICRDDDIMCFAPTKKQCVEDMAKLRAHDKKRLIQLKNRYNSVGTSNSTHIPAGLSVTVSMGGGNIVRDRQAISEHMDKVEKEKDYIKTTMSMLKSYKYCALKVPQFPHVHAQSNPIFTKQLTNFMLDSTID